MRRLNILKISLSVIPMLFLSACWNATSIEHIYYAHTVGVDFQDGKYIVYAQMVNFTGSTGQGGGGSNENPSALAVVAGKGETLTEAIHDLYPATQRKIFWGHLSSIIFSQQVLKKNFINVLDKFNRFHQTRPTLWIYATDMPLDQLLTIKPIIEPNAIFSFLGEPWESYEQSILIRPVRMNRFIASINEPGKTTLFPVIRFGNNRWKNLEGQVENLLFNDVAVLENKQFKGILSENQLLGIRWIQGVNVRTPVIVHHEGEAVATFIATKANSKILPKWNNGIPTFDIQVRVDGYIIELIEEETKNVLQKQIEEKVKKQIETTYLEGLKIKSDIFSFSHILYKDNPKKWKQLSEEGGLTLTEESLSSISVIVHIEHAGSEKLLLQ